MTQHTYYTQSPWYVEHPYGEPGVYISDRETSALIAKLYGPDAEANALKVAALPLLLEACEAIAKLAQGQGRANLIEVAAQAARALEHAKGLEEFSL